MKRLSLRLTLTLLLVLLATLVLSGCTVKVGPRPAEKVLFEPILLDRDPYAGISSGKVTLGNKDYVYRWSTENEPIVMAQIDTLNALIAEGTDEKAFEEAYCTADEMLNVIVTQQRLAYVEYCILQGSAEAEENYLHINEFFLDFYQDMIVMYQTIYDSDFRDFFYEDWTEEEIRQALDMAAEYTDEYMELQKETDEMTVAYRDMDLMDDRAEIRDLYLEFAKVNDRIAKNLGYENYMDYAYASVYGRDYTPEDAEEIVEYFREYLVPLIKPTYNAFVSDALSDDSAYERFMTLEKGVSFNSYEGKLWLKKYYEALDKEAIGMYNDLFEDGNYFYTRLDSSYAGAFTWYLFEYETPFMYFSKGYDDLLTFVHEFGHYMAFIHSESGSMDVDETQSQGDEMLFHYYLKDVVNSDILWEMYNEYELFDSLLYMSLELIINDFESYVYTHLDTLTPDDLDQVFCNSVMKIYGDSKLKRASEDEPMTGYDLLEYMMEQGPEIYWYAVCVESPGYYISYAVSEMMAVELFAQAMDEGFDAAADTYMKLIHAEDKPFCELMRDCGLYDVLDENTYILIHDVITDNYLSDPE